MRAPYIQGLIHDGNGNTTQFLIGPDGYRQWGFTGPTAAAQAGRNVTVLEALEEAANKVGFFEYPEDDQQYLGVAES